MTYRTLSLLAALLLAGCDASLAERKEPPPSQPPAEEATPDAPKTCWDKVVTPAAIETAPDQTAAPATSKTETHQTLVQEPKETSFEIPCPPVLTPEFVRSLQRALAARDLYGGSISGKMNKRTRAAIRQFQKPDGLDSDVLSIAAARKMGLIAVELPED